MFKKPLATPCSLTRLVHIKVQHTYRVYFILHTLQVLNIRGGKKKIIYDYKFPMNEGHTSMCNNNYYYYMFNKKDKMTGTSKNSFLRPTFRIPTAAPKPLQKISDIVYDEILFTFFHFTTNTINIVNCTVYTKLWVVSNLSAKLKSGLNTCA